MIALSSTTDIRDFACTLPHFSAFSRAAQRLMGCRG
jgi:hypothetical protein